MPLVLNRSTTAKAIGHDLQISPKVSIELSNFLRGREVEKAIAILNRVILKTQAVPYKRYTNGPGHKPGMASGRYPVKASGEFLKLLNNAKANAANQGLTGTLVITHIAANKAAEPFRQRAKERNSFKRCHVEIILTQQTAEAADKNTKRAAQRLAKPTAKSEKKEHAENKHAEKSAEKKDAKPTKHKVEAPIQTE